MNPDRAEFLKLAILPARLSSTETAWYLGFTNHDISTLVSAGILKPCGHPPASGSKYFASAVLERLRSNTNWLDRASDATVKYWKKKNAGRVRRKAASAVNGGQRNGVSSKVTARSQNPGSFAEAACDPVETN